MKTAREPSRLLIVRNDRVGDLVLTLPTLEYVRKLLPASHITVLAGSRTSALLQSNPHIDQVLADDRTWSARQLAKRLCVERFDAALVIHGSTRNYLAVWLAGIPTRVTSSRRPAGWLLGNRHVTLRRSHPPIHESEFALAFARKIGSDPSIHVSVPRLFLDPEAVMRIRARIFADIGNCGPLFGVHPGNYSSASNWPPERYVELITRLARHGSVVVTGGPGEERLLGHLRDGLPGKLAHGVAFYHEFDLVELCAALSLIDVLTVSNTGPMHLASVLGTPVVALFSSHLSQCAAKWAPLGRHNKIFQAPLLPHENVPNSSEQEHEQMCRIPLEDVVEANLEFLRTRASRERARA